jgi:hypothetical protein
MLSNEILGDFLPVGRDFTIPAPNFLPVGNGLRGSPVTDDLFDTIHRGKA